MDDAQRGTESVTPLRAARQALWMTQVELARKAGVGVRTIISVEAGHPCRQSTKRKLLAALGVPFEERDRVFPRNEK